MVGDREFRCINNAGSNLLAGSNQRQSTYLGGYQQVAFDDGIQDMIAMHMNEHRPGHIGVERIISPYQYNQLYGSLSGQDIFEGAVWGAGWTTGAYGVYERLSKNPHALKALNHLGTATGLYSTWSHGRQAYSEYQSNGFSRQFYIDAGRTAVDAGFLIYRGSNPFILGGSVIYSIGDTYYDIHYRK